MFSSYLKLALRSLRRQRLYSTINIVGLSVGIAASLILLSYVQSEWSYDRSFRDGGNVYRVEIETVNVDGGPETTAGQPLPLQDALMEEIPSVRAATSLRVEQVSARSIDDVIFDESAYFVGQSFFEVFPFPVESGNRTDLLVSPDQIVISASMARKYFGATDAVGRVMEIGQGGEVRSFTVSAVLADVDYNSTIRPDIVLRLESLSDYAELQTSWTSWGINSFALLKNGTDARTLEQSLASFTDEHYEPMIRTWKILKWISPDEGSFHLSLRPLKDIHFSNRVQQLQTAAADPIYPYILTLLASAILLLACINFTTLATARALKRVREVGLRKVLGADRRQLIGQFQGEALLFTLLALILGLGLAQSLLPQISTTLGVNLNLGLASGSGFLLILALTVVTAVIAGIYPSVYLSRFSPIDIIRRSVSTGRNRWMQALVILQFSLTGAFLFAALVIQGQLSFIRKADLGFEKEQLLAVSLKQEDPLEADRVFERVRSRATSLDGVTGVAASSSGFDRSLAWNSFSTPDGGAHLIYTNRVSVDFIDEMGMRLLDGRSFSKEFSSDLRESVVVNEALVDEYGWDYPIGKTLDNFSLVKDVPARVIGVVEDYNFKSLHSRVEPIALFLAPRDPFRFIYFRLKPGPTASTVASIRSLWTGLNPGQAFSSFFVDDDLSSRYEDDRRWQSMIGYAGILAILIACMGLFGLSAFSAQRRTRELGVRKVLGASTSSLTGMLTLEYLRLVLVAEIVALPVAILMMKIWLERFAYRYQPGIPEILISVVTVFGLALMTVSYQAVRAARTDPSVSLRYE